jgi:hypothetical protein
MSRQPSTISTTGSVSTSKPPLNGACREHGSRRGFMGRYSGRAVRGLHSMHTNNEIVYWHGGPAGLQVGDLIKPPTVTGVRNRCDGPLLRLLGYIQDRVDPAAPNPVQDYRRDRVYVSTDRSISEWYAACPPSRPGAIYRVQPLGLLEVDPWPKYQRKALTCPSARVLEVCPLTAAEQAKIYQGRVSEISENLHQLQVDCERAVRKGQEIADKVNLVLDFLYPLCRRSEA